MLLRSASSPLLNCARALAEHFTLLSPPLPTRHQGAALCRAMSEGDLLLPAVRKQDDGYPTPLSASSYSVEEEDEYDDENVVVAAGAPVPLRRLLTSTGLDSSSSPPATATTQLAVVEEEAGVGGGGRQDGDSGSRAAADAHYRGMIEADPDNSLVLGNYARFLKEVEGDPARALHFCERAILANPADADALSLYAGLVWETSRDAQRADGYYSRAVQAAPDDWSVTASHHLPGFQFVYRSY